MHHTILESATGELTERVFASARVQRHTTSSRVAQTIGIKASKRPIRIVDGSRIEGPGNRAWRLHLCYDPNLARITDAAITTLCILGVSWYFFIAPTLLLQRETQVATATLFTAL